MVFLKGIGESLVRIEVDIKNIAKDISEMKNDLKFLKGKDIPTLLQYRYS